MTVIDKIKDAFSLNIVDFSDVCLVGRQTPYRRMFDLLLAADKLINSGLSLSEHDLHSPVVNNESIFDMLKSNELDSEKIIFAGTRLKLREKPKKLVNPFS